MGQIDTICIIILRTRQSLLCLFLFVLLCVVVKRMAMTPHLFIVQSPPSTSTIQKKLPPQLQPHATSISSRHIDIQWLPSRNITRWYSPWEVCVLSRPSSYIVKDSKSEMQLCAKQVGFPSKPYLRCRLGNPLYHVRLSIGSPVNMQVLPHLSQVIAGYDDPSRSYLKEFLTVISQRDFSILMVGDSSMQQLANFMTCEEERIGIHPFEFVQYRQKVKVDGVEVHVDVQKIVMFDESNVQKLYNFSHTILKENQKNLFLIINTGLWYTEKNSYADDVKHLFQELEHIMLLAKQMHKLITIVWMESPAQHFATPSGYYTNQTEARNRVRVKSVNMTCPSLLDRDLFYNEEDEYESDWRNDIIWKQYILGPFGQHISQLDFAQLGVLNLRAVTRQLYDIHIRESAMRDADCTHFMFTPMLYQFIYHQLLNISISSHGVMV